MKVNMLEQVIKLARENERLMITIEALMRRIDALEAKIEELQK